MDSWLIPAQPVTLTEEIKKSRFITRLAHTPGVEAAKGFVPTRVTTALPGWQARRMIHSS